jgi:ABC-type transport system involved in multi-copper enzyme maturation permease subunit
MSGALIVARFALRESMRRRVFLVVLVLTVAFLVLYAFGANAAFDEVGSSTESADASEADPVVVTGSTLLGLAMFATLFLGTVLAVFLTLGAVRGDAERGLLQSLVVRPLGRPALLLGRFLGAASVCAAYVAALYAASVAITEFAGDWAPDHVVGPGLNLVAAVVVVAAVSLLGSVFLASTANGIAVLMVFGAGLVAGLLGQIGDALPSDTLETIGTVGSLALPFEALYQSGLHGLTSETTGLTGFIVKLGPFGGAQRFGAGLWPWAVAYVALAGALATWRFRRTDL